MKNVKAQKGSPRARILDALKNKDLLRFDYLANFTNRPIMDGIARDLGIVPEGSSWEFVYGDGEDDYQDFLADLFNEGSSGNYIYITE